MSNYSILDILSMGEITNVGQNKEMSDVTDEFKKFQDELGLENQSSVAVQSLPKEYQAKAIELMNKRNSVQQRMSDFSLNWKRSVAELNRTYGLPVHINAKDIHDYNIDIDTIVHSLTTDDKDSQVAINEFFHDNSLPAFAIAPYNYCFVELESESTYANSIGQYYKNKYGEEGMGNKRYGTYILIQSWKADDYVEYLHNFRGDVTVGTKIKDTLSAHFDLPSLKDNEEVMGQLDIMDLELDDLEFIQFFDIITVGEINGKPVASLDNQIMSWYDKYGQPNITRQLNPFDISDKNTTAEQVYYCTSLEKVFQWWNSDNDLLEPVDLEQRPSWNKRLKNYNKKNKSKEKSKIQYKTLSVRRDLKVVDSNGEERTPLLREIAQHTRRGHWAKYGFDGHGKLFGKYDKLVYRKPKTIGKLANGLVIKDYSLEKRKLDRNAS